MRGRPIVLAAALLALAAPGKAEAHFQTYEYTLSSCPATFDHQVDPINMVFWRYADNPTTKNAIQFHGPWQVGGGSTQYFSSHGVCGAMYDQEATSCPACTRFHIRYKRTYEDDVNLGQTSRGDAHHEDWVPTCNYGLGGHAVDKNGPEGSGFDQGRRKLRLAFDADAEHPWYSKFWANQRNFKQCDGEYAGSDGYTVYIKLHDHLH
jgi:hypothetical protein